MSLKIITTTNVEDPAKFIAETIIKKLSEGKSVLFFVTGGSSVAVASKISELLEGKSLTNLTVMLTDERYGPLKHENSNWFRLVKNGFNVPGSTFVPILVGEGIISTTQKFNTVLDQQLKTADYKIGLFGIGKDGHTAGILPGSIAVESQDLAASYDTPIFVRITITPKTIEKLDEAVVWMQGEEKWPVVKNLIESDLEIIKQPAQILKKIPLLTIFTDYKNI
jgi:6-phosphogluconolactonase/glucosamine-6-phosphate isomerase/deaminase